MYTEAEFDKMLKTRRRRDRISRVIGALIILSGIILGLYYRHLGYRFDGPYRIYKTTQVK